MGNAVALVDPIEKIAQSAPDLSVGQVVIVALPRPPIRNAANCVLNTKGSDDPDPLRGTGCSWPRKGQAGADGAPVRTSDTLATTAWRNELLVVTSAADRASILVSGNRHQTLQERREQPP